MPVTKEYILTALQEIIDDPEIKVADRLKAIKMVGEHLKMFTKEVKIDFRALLAQVSSNQLRGLSNERRIGSGYTTEVQANADTDPALLQCSDGAD